MSANPYNHCKHKETIAKDGYIVCKKCGITLDRHIVDTHSTSDINYLQKQTFFTQCVSRGNTLLDKRALGSQIDETLKDKNNKLLLKFRRIQELDKKLSFKEIEYELVVRDAFTNICDHLSLPKRIQEDALYRYEKLRKEECIDHGTTYYALGFCLWSSIKTHSYPITFKQILLAFRENGHRLKARYVNLRQEKYIKALEKYNLKTNSHREIKDYIPFIISSIKELLSMRLKKKHVDGYTVKDYMIKLENLSVDIQQKLKTYLTKKAERPFNKCCALIYFADRLLSLKNNHKPLLTYNLLSNTFEDFCCFSQVSEIYREYFKPFYKREKERIKKKRGLC